MTPVKEKIIGAVTVMTNADAESFWELIQKKYAPSWDAIEEEEPDETGLQMLEAAKEDPDGERAKLVDGQIYYMAPPSTRHQRLVHFLDWAIEDYIRKKQGGCEVFPAPFAVFLNEDDTNYLEPDISVICDPAKLDDKGCHGAPDWIIEIVSSGSKTMDYYTKLFKYGASGVREYWIVDPAKKSVMVYGFEKDTMGEYAFSEDIPAGIYDDLSIKIE